MTRREAPVSPPVVLTIAGSDSGGGAGIQADLKTIEACGGFGTSAITSVTAQNTQGVRGSHGLPIADIEAQIEAVLDDFDVAAVKTGMLATSDVVELVTDHAEGLPNLVVDPVMVATSGDRLLAEEAEDAYEDLVERSTLVTPNADEAEVLTGVAVDDVEAAERAGRILVRDHGADAALVKGGHVPGDQVVDTLVTGTDRSEERRDAAEDGDDSAVTTLRHERVDTEATHGSGCTLSSAIATRLAHGDDLESAVGAGIDLLARAVRYNVDVGEGPGAVHHLVELRDDASRQSTADLVALLADHTGVGNSDGDSPSAVRGLAGATPHAEAFADVAALSGRTALASGDGAAVENRPAPGRRSIAFGADDALASVLLAVREVDPALRFAALVECDPARLDGIGGSAVDEGTSDGIVDAPSLRDDVAGASPVPAKALETLSAAEEPPVAVSLTDRGTTGASAPAGGQAPLAILFGPTTDRLLERIGKVSTSAGGE